MEKKRIDSGAIAQRVVIFRARLGYLSGPRRPIPFCEGEPMTAEQITTIITNVLTGGGVAVFLYMVIRGLKDQIVALKAQIGTLNETIEVQKKTLQAMETRVLETEKIGNIYRQFLEEFPKELENYRALHTKMKDDQIKLLQQANEQKDERLKETAEIELEKLKLQQRALDDIPKLLGQITDTARTLEQRLSTVDQLAGTTPLELHLADVRKSLLTAFMSSLWSHDLSKLSTYYLFHTDKKDGKDAEGDKTEANGD